jgi:hypothetical protein
MGAKLTCGQRRGSQGLQASDGCSNVLSFEFVDVRGSFKGLLSVSCATDGAVSKGRSPWSELAEASGDLSIAGLIGISFVNSLSASPASLVLSYIVGKYKTENGVRGNDKSRFVSHSPDISDGLNWVKKSMS